MKKEIITGEPCPTCGAICPPATLLICEDEAEARTVSAARLEPVQFFKINPTYPPEVVALVKAARRIMREARESGFEPDFASVPIIEMSDLSESLKPFADLK